MTTLTPILTNAATIRQKIHDKTTATLAEVFPLDLKGRTLEVKDLRVHAKDYSPEEQKRALLTGTTLQEAVKGTLVLRGADGSVIDKAEDFTLVHVPYFTERHTVITDGNEYQIANQIRRKPGVYTQRADNGELRTIFNLGKGKNFDLSFNDKKGTFYLQYGATNIPMYAVLRGLGVPHEDIAKKLGSGVADANRLEHGKAVETSIGKLYAKLEHPSIMNAKAPHDAKLEAVRKKLGQTTLDKDVVEQTLGHGHESVTVHALMDAASKILKVHAGKDTPDDTDSLTFKTFHSVDTHLAERLRLTARQWAPKAKMALNGKSNIREALRPAPFSESLRKFITTSTLSAVPTGINPMELIDHAMKVTALGEGGISSDRAIPLDARMTHSTHFGSLDPIRTPESNHSGVDVRASIVAHRDDAGNLYTVVTNARTRQEEFLRSGDLLKHVVAFPHQPLHGKVDAFVKGEVQKVDAEKVDYQMQHMSHQYSPATTLIPLIQNIQGNRAIMGSKMGTQALPLLHREVPYVQVKSHVHGMSFESLYGHMINPTAPVSGVVKKIEGGWVYIQPDAKKQAEMEKDAAGPALVRVPYQQHFPFPSKTYLHHELNVGVGDRVTEGAPISDSNYTRKGVLALGKNLSVAYMGYHGLNSNDAVVISEGAAKKLTSEHMYREVYPLTSAVELNKAKHQMYFGSKYTPSQYRNLDESGVIKKGSKVHHKDLIVSGLTKNVVQGTDALLGRINKSLVKPFREVNLFWEHGTEGEVIDVVRTSSQIAILIKTQEVMQVGDKLAGRYGNKGVVAKIVPDHEMIQDEAGNPVDLILTSAGVISRINPAQIIETAVGKVAEKTRKPIIYDNAERKDAVKWAKDLLAEHNIKDKEHVYDPISKRTIKGADGKGVFVGRQYIYKLFKSTDTNFAGHGVGPYDINEQPLKTGGDMGAKSIAKMEFDALLAHNARGILQESATVRSQKNEEFWKAIQLGQPLPTPKTSFAFNKLVGMLDGSGVRVDKRGSKIRLMPMTDKDILARSAGEIKNSKTIIAKNLKPEDGGLFDPRLTGGPQGTLYSHISLHEVVPNPVFEEPIRRLMGWSQKDFDMHLRSKGGAWIKSQLQSMDLDRKLVDLRGQLTKASGSMLNDVVKQIKYLEALKAEGMRPHDAYMLSKVPVVPPIFRPILPQPNDPSQLMVADANKLYGHLMDSNHVLKTTVLESDTGAHRAQLYNAVGAVFGTHEVENDELKGQAVKGFLSNIAGVGTPKGGFFQRKLMRRTQDVSGRGTAVPDGNLGMDEVGVPEQMLWQMFDKLIVARLIRQGYPNLMAREMVDKKAPMAREAMLAETRDRPVIINRAPTLHRWSIIAANAVPVQGKTIRVNPFIEKGMNLDYDGDTLTVHAPVTTSGVADARSMTLSNLLLSDQQRNKLMVFPQHEAIIGYTLAAKAKGNSSAVRKFASRDEALAAYRRGELKLEDNIEVAHMKTAEEEDDLDTEPYFPLTEKDALDLYPPEAVTGYESD